MKNLKGIKDIINLYDIFILDQWGVMHDGKQGYPHAIKCINYLYSKKKKLIIISNSSKRNNSSIQRLQMLGFKTDLFDKVMTSGEMIWQSLSFSINNYGTNLSKCFHIYDKSNPEELIYRQGLSKIRFVKNINEANFILACTPIKNSLPTDYIPLLNQAYELKLLMFCANPDFETIENKNNKKTICMGTIAQLYKEIGGKVIILGKPSVEIYKEATKCLNINKKSRIVSIGDSLFHDIQGANNFKIDSILVTSGIHSDYFIKSKPVWESEKNKLLKYNIQPTYLTSQFSL